MKWTTLSSVKGGVGRTTIALNLSYALATQGQRVLLIEADPQGGLGHLLGAKVADSPGLSCFLAGFCSIEQTLVQTRLPTLSLMPWGSVDYGASMELCEQLADGSLFAQIKAKYQGQFDRVLIDTPSGLGAATRGALLVSEGLLSPLQASPACLRSSTKMLEALATFHSTAHSTPFAWQKFVLNMWTSEDPVSIRVAQEIQHAFPPGVMLRTSIPTNPTVGDAEAAATPLALLSRQFNPLVNVFQELAAETESLWGTTTQEVYNEPLSLVD